jgi:hypothetical protein
MPDARHARSAVMNRTLPFEAGDPCALCQRPGDQALTVPVFGASGPGVRRVCEHCLSSVLGVALQLLGHAPAVLARAAVSMQDTGHA